MKPELEIIDLVESDLSFRFFKTEVSSFPSFWHYHPEVELTYIIRGSGTRFIGDSIQPFFDGDLVMIGSDLPHNFVGMRHEEEGEQSAFVFQFNMGIFSSLKECNHFKYLFDDAQKGIHFQNVPECMIQMIFEFGQLCKVHQLTALMQLLDYLCSHGQQKLLCSKDYFHSQTRSIKKFAGVNDYILEHLDAKLTIDHMAELTNMVPQSFCRWFKKHSGHSFINFINKARIENACQLLMNGNTPIREVAFLSGYESVSHFNRTFKKFKSMTPREMIKQSHSTKDLNSSHIFSSYRHQTDN